MGALPAAFAVTQTKSGAVGALDLLSQLEPARFLSAPGLWIGLALAAAFLAAAVRMRRDREPT